MLKQNNLFKITNFIVTTLVFFLFFSSITLFIEAFTITDAYIFSNSLKYSVSSDEIKNLFLCSFPLDRYDYLLASEKHINDNKALIFKSATGFLNDEGKQQIAIIETWPLKFEGDEEFIKNELAQRIYLQYGDASLINYPYYCAVPQSIYEALYGTNYNDCVDKKIIIYNDGSEIVLNIAGIFSSEFVFSTNRYEIYKKTFGDAIFINCDTPLNYSQVSMSLNINKLNYTNFLSLFKNNNIAEDIILYDNFSEINDRFLDSLKFRDKLFLYRVSFSPIILSLCVFLFLFYNFKNRKKILYNTNDFYNSNLKCVLCSTLGFILVYLFCLGNLSSIGWLFFIYLVSVVAILFFNYYIFFNIKMEKINV